MRAEPAGAESSPARGAWAYVRAALIALVLLAQWADAMPLPELKKRDLDNPIAQDELRRWQGVLAGLGVELTTEELAQWGLDVGQSMRKGRRAVLSPWAPFRRITGTGQGWGLFAYPDPYAGRLVVAERLQDGAWETFYTAPQTEGGLLARQLRYRRIRGIWDDAGDRVRPRDVYDRFATWIARRRFEERADLELVEVRLDLHRVETPGAGEEPPDKRRHARVRRRADVMGTVSTDL